MPKNVVIISDAPSWARGLAGLLRAYEEDSVRCISSKRALGRVDPNAVLILRMQDPAALQRWIWRKIRSNYPSPIIVLGDQDPRAFGKEQPAFNGCRGEMLAYKSHRYLKMPVSLPRLRAAVAGLKPVATQLGVMFRFYANMELYLAHRIHRIKNSEHGYPYSYEETRARLREVLEYMRATGKRSAIGLAGRINRLRKNGEWRCEASDLRDDIEMEMRSWQ